MANENLDVIIRFLLDQAANDKTTKGTEAVSDGIKEVEKYAKDMGVTLTKSFDELIKGGYSAEAAIKRITREIKQIDPSALKQVIKETKSADTAAQDYEKTLIRTHATQAALYSAQARLLQNQVTQERARVSELNRISSGLGQVSGISLGAGVGIVGGIFAGANKYVKDAKEATAVTIQWKQAQDSLQESGSKVGAVLAERALPLLKTAAELADKAAGFVQQHPEIVTAALNTGIVLSGLGAVGIAVSKGIKFYADSLYLASVPVQLEAARLQAAAATEQLAAARLRAIPSTYGVTGGLIGPAEAVGGGAAAGAGAGIAATIATTLLALIVGGVTGSKIGDALAKKINPEDTKQYGISDYFTEFKQALVLDAAGLTRLVAGQEKGNEVFKSVAVLLGLRGNNNTQAAPNSATGTKASPEFENILKAYEKYKTDDLALVQNHYAERNKIISDSLQSEQESNKKYADSYASVAGKRRSDLANEDKKFADDNAKADKQYADSRAQIIKDGNDSIQTIEQQSQERLRKLAQDHAGRMDDLTRARDALGLVKEQRSYNQQRSDEISNTNKEVQQRRRDIVQKLADLQQSYVDERAQRLLDHQARIEEIKKNASEQLSQLASQHADELREIRKARIDKLNELDSTYADERKRREQQFIQNVRDLDASLLGEQALKDKYYKESIASLDAYLAKYKSGLNAVASASTYGKAAGGYASYGMYRLGDSPNGTPGPREYVLSGSTTQVAERALGGQITQDRLIQALSFAGGNSGNQTNYTDNRKLPSTFGPVERNMIREDMKNVMKEVFKNALSR